MICMHVRFVSAINVHWTLSSREHLWKFFRLPLLMSSKSVKLCLTFVEYQTWFLKANKHFCKNSARVKMAYVKFLLLWRRMSCHRCVLRLVSHFSDKRVRLMLVLFDCFSFFMWLLFNRTGYKVEYNTTEDRHSSVLTGWWSHSSSEILEQPHGSGEMCPNWRRLDRLRNGNHRIQRQNRT